MRIKYSFFSIHKLCIFQLQIKSMLSKITTKFSIIDLIHVLIKVSIFYAYNISNTYFLIIRQNSKTWLSINMSKTIWNFMHHINNTLLLIKCNNIDDTKYMNLICILPFLDWISILKFNFFLQINNLHKFKNISIICIIHWSSKINLQSINGK